MNKKENNRKIIIQKRETQGNTINIMKQTSIYKLQKDEHQIKIDKSKNTTNE